MCLRRSIAKLDASRLAAPANIDLGFDDNRPAQLAGNRFSLFRRIGHSSRLNRDAIARQNIFGLIFVNFHRTNAPYATS